MDIAKWQVSVLIVAVVLNILVSIFLLKRDDLEPYQEGAQIGLVWTITLTAPIGLWLLSKSNDVEAKSLRDFGGGHRDNSDVSREGDW